MPHMGMEMSAIERRISEISDPILRDRVNKIHVHLFVCLFWHQIRIMGTLVAIPVTILLGAWVAQQITNRGILQGALTVVLFLITFRGYRRQIDSKIFKRQEKRELDSVIRLTRSDLENRKALNKACEIDWRVASLGDQVQKHTLETQTPAFSK